MSIQALDPSDTGEIPVGEGTRNLTAYLTAPPRSPLPPSDVADTVEVELPAREVMLFADVPTLRVARFDPATTAPDLVPGLAFQPALRPAAQTAPFTRRRGAHRAPSPTSRERFVWLGVGAAVGLGLAVVLAFGAGFGAFLLGLAWSA